MNNETKLKGILRRKQVSQTKLYERIKDQCKVKLGRDVISLITNGKKTNYHIDTLLKICLALDVSPNDIVEKENFIDQHIR